MSFEAAQHPRSTDGRFREAQAREPVFADFVPCPACGQTYCPGHEGHGSRAEVIAGVVLAAHRAGDHSACVGCLDHGPAGKIITGSEHLDQLRRMFGSDPVVAQAATAAHSFLPRDVSSEGYQEPLLTPAEAFKATEAIRAARMRARAQAAAVESFLAQYADDDRLRPDAPPDLRRALDVAMSFNRTDQWFHRDGGSGHVIVRKANGGIRVYRASAWTEPAQTPLLPWRPPSGTPIISVGPDDCIEIL